MKFTRINTVQQHQGKLMIQAVKCSYFLPRNCPMRASQRPHLCRVTPLYLELPRENPVLCLRRTCTNSSLDRLFIWCTKEDRTGHVMSCLHIQLQILH